MLSRWALPDWVRIPQMSLLRMHRCNSCIFHLCSAKHEKLFAPVALRLCLRHLQSTMGHVPSVWHDVQVWLMREGKVFFLWSTTLWTAMRPSSPDSIKGLGSENMQVVATRRMILHQPIAWAPAMDGAWRSIRTHCRFNM